jgi:hypothetical protein
MFRPVAHPSAPLVEYKSKGQTLYRRVDGVAYFQFKLACLEADRLSEEYGFHFQVIEVGGGGGERPYIRVARE